MLHDLPWGRLGLTICYDLRFPALYRALARGRRLVPRHPVRLHPADRRGALARAQPRARHRERLLRAGGGAGRQARERPRDLRPFAGGRSLGPHRRRGRHRARRGDGRDRSGRGRRGARPRALAAARPPLRDGRADGGADPSARGAEVRHDPLFARLRAQARIRNLVQELRRLRQAGEARAGDLPGLRLRQGREGADGAVARPRHQEGRAARAAPSTPPRAAAPAEAPRRPRPRRRSR